MSCFLFLRVHSLIKGTVTIFGRSGIRKILQFYWAEIYTGVPLMSERFLNFK